MTELLFFKIFFGLIAFWVILLIVIVTNWGGRK